MVLTTLSADFAERIRSRSVDVEVEIGCNDGDFLARLARSRPERLYVGVEIDEGLSAKAHARMLNAGLSNVAIVHREGLDFLCNCLERSTVDAIHVYFPTPFPDAVGLEERLLTEKFFREAARVVRIGGDLRFVTDNETVYAEAARSFGAAAWYPVAWIGADGGRETSLLVDTPWARRVERAGSQAMAVQLTRIA